MSLSIETTRIKLIPYTIEICQSIIDNNFDFLTSLGLIKGKGWPDQEVMETIPKIITNLMKVKEPTGFESWMIIKTESAEIIGDIGFKGFNSTTKSVDLGYGIIAEERSKGYALESATALIDWAFLNKELNVITARCYTENKKSYNLLKKLYFEINDINHEMTFWSLTKEKQNLPHTNRY